MDWSLLVSGAGVALNAVVIGFWKPWLSAYGGEKGKNLARKEDLNEILSEVRAVTITQKEIESRLAGDLWSRQTLWNERKNFYALLLTALYRAIRACNDFLQVRQAMAQGEHWEQPGIDIDATITNVLNNIGESQAELIRLRSLAEIFTSAYSAGVLTNYLTSDRRLRRDSTAELIIQQRERLVVLNNHIVTAAKRDLGITEA